MSALRLDDGFSTVFTLDNLPTIKLYEKEVTPPGFTAGGPIETTTMRNTEWRTMAPRQLKTLTPVSATVAYATEAYPLIRDQVGILQLITVRFPDSSSIDFYGWVEEFTPGANKEGDQPTASMTIQPSNRNLAGVESAPVYYPSEASSGQ